MTAQPISAIAVASRQAVLLVFVSLVFGGLTAWLHPRMPAYAEGRMGAGALHLAAIEAQETPVLWVDARTEAEFEEAHIPGAILVNEDDWEGGLMRFMNVWDPAHWVVVYCDAETCQASQAVMQRLKDELGIDNVYYLEGGWQVWKEAQP